MIMNDDDDDDYDDWNVLDLVDGAMCCCGEISRILILFLPRSVFIFSGLIRFHGDVDCTGSHQESKLYRSHRWRPRLGTRYQCGSECH